MTAPWIALTASAREALEKMLASSKIVDPFVFMVWSVEPSPDDESQNMGWDCESKEIKHVLDHISAMADELVTHLEVSVRSMENFPYSKFVNIDDFMFESPLEQADVTTLLLDFRSGFFSAIAPEGQDTSAAIQLEVREKAREIRRR